MLSIEWTSQEPATTALQTLVVVLASPDCATVLERLFGAPTAQAAVAGRFTGRLGDQFRFARERDGSLQTVVLLGLGADAPTAGRWRSLAHEALRAAQVGSLQLVLDLRQVTGLTPATPQLGNLLAQGLELATYRYDRYIAEARRKPSTVQRVTVLSEHTAASEGLARGQTIATAVARARDLVNGPANEVTPTYLAEFAAAVVGRLKDCADVVLEVLEREDCEKLGMGCYLGVAQCGRSH